MMQSAKDTCQHSSCVAIHPLHLVGEYRRVAAPTTTHPTAMTVVGLLLGLLRKSIGKRQSPA